MFLYPFRSIAGGPMFQYCDGVTCSYSWMHFGMGHTLPSLNELIWDMLLAVPNEKLQPRKSIFNNGKIGWLGSFNGEDIYDIFLFTNVTAYINSLDPKKKTVSITQVPCCTVYRSEQMVQSNTVCYLSYTTYASIGILNVCRRKPSPRLTLDTTKKFEEMTI